MRIGINGSGLIATGAPVGQITEHALRNYAAHAIEAAGISRYGVLLQVRFVKTLVKTSVGKMNKRLMRADPDALCI